MKPHQLLSFSLFFIACSNAYAGGFTGDTTPVKEKPQTDGGSQGLIHLLTGTNLNDTALLKNGSIRVGGAIVGGVTYNPASPQDRSNYPMTFNDRSNEFQLNRFRLFAQRDVDMSGKSWDIGGRFDFMIGADARYASAFGLDDRFNAKNRFNKSVLPQFYATIFAPYGNGINIQIGHFFTLIGSLSPFYSLSYVAYSEPSSHTGVLFSTTLNDEWSVSAGAVLGTVNTFDNFSKFGNNWGFLGSATWAKDTTTATISLISGDDTSDETVNGVGIRQANRTHVSVVLNQDFAQKWHYKFQHDYGYQAQGFNATAAHWYGIEQDLMYDVTDQLTAGLRAEWFRDQEGLKVMYNGIPTTYYGMTAGLFWKPVKWITVRPEVRYDISSNPVYNVQNGIATDQQQFSFATSFAVRF